jgi:uncharacterized membrane protein
MIPILIFAGISLLFLISIQLWLINRTLIGLNTTLKMICVQQEQHQKSIDRLLVNAGLA